MYAPGMISRWRLPQGRVSESAVDTGLAIVIAVLGVAELWGNSAMRPHAAAATPLYLVMAAGVAFRRSRPMVAVAMTGLSGNLALVVGIPMNQIFVPVMAFLIVDYSVAAHTHRREAIAGFVLLLMCVWGGITLSSSPHGLGDYATALLQLGAAWAAGRTVRYRLHRAISAERRAVEAEHEAADAAQRAVLHERVRIARELHDIVSHGVSVMVVQAGAAERVLDHDEPRAKQALHAIQEVGRESLEEMQRLLGVLRLDEDDEALDPQPSLGQLDQLVSNVRQAGLPVHVTIEGEVRPLSAGLDLCIYRLIQEALTNALKYSGLSPTRVAVRYEANAVDLEIVDQGRNDLHARPGTGHGLVGMRERVALYGGQMEAGATTAGGFQVRATLPTVAS
jgi:signal transduction histidine kinase